MKFFCYKSLSTSKSVHYVQFLNQQHTFVEEVLKHAKLPTLYNRHLQDVATLIYKVKNNLVPSYVSEIVTHKRTRYHLRNSDLEMPRLI